MDETDTATRIQDILYELNDYVGDPWDEFIYTLPEYDAERTAAVHQGVGGAFVALGMIFRYDMEDGCWTVQQSEQPL